MTFACFYNVQDITPIVANVNNPNLASFGLTSAERQVAARVWNGGLKDWAVAPYTMTDPVNAWRALGDADCRTIVVNAQGVTLQMFRDLLYSVAAKVPGAAYMKSIADDLAGDAALEPWVG